MSNLRLYAIVLRLTALRPGAVPEHHGDFARDAFFDLVNRGDSGLASALHDENEHKPYTIAPLHGGKRGPDGARHFGLGDEAYWRFTLLCEPAFEAILRRYILNQAMPHIRIGVVEFGITDAFASGERHPESGHTTIQELQERWNVPPETLARTLTMEFLTPTAYNLGYDRETKRRDLHTLPTPQYVFSALRKQWLALGGAAPDDSFDQWVASHVDMSALDIQPRRAKIKGNMLPGFVGTVTYRVRRDDRWWSVVHLLSAFAFWRGCGYQTTCGMGQARTQLHGGTLS